MVDNQNKLKKVRIGEGLTVPDLARFSKVSERTISDIEKEKRPGSAVTRQRIVTGLNNNPSKTRTWEHDEIFGS